MNKKYKIRHTSKVKHQYANGLAFLSFNRAFNCGLFFVLLVYSFPLKSQHTEKNRYGVTTISALAVYQQLVREDSTVKLVDLQKHIPGIRLDIRYATNNNFLGQPVYNDAKAYLALPAARAIRNVEKELNEKGLALKIYDAYRPYSITVLFYEKAKDTVFVASPYRGSRHNRGMAIDLTLVDRLSGKELNMPTAFDDFTKKAHIDYPDLPGEIIKHRTLLIAVMAKHGFEVYPDEWWHFDFKGWQQHPLLDISFKELSFE